MRLCQYQCVQVARSDELKYHINADTEELPEKMLRFIWSEVRCWLHILQATIQSCGNLMTENFKLTFNSQFCLHPYEQLLRSIKLKTVKSCPHHKGIWGSRGMAPLILHFNIRWKWVVNIKSQLLFLCERTSVTLFMILEAVKQLRVSKGTVTYLPHTVQHKVKINSIKSNQCCMISFG